MLKMIDASLERPYRLIEVPGPDYTLLDWLTTPIQSNEFHSIMDDLYKSILSH